MLFINIQKSSVLPQRCSASATAASFPETNNNPYSRARTEIFSPVERCIEDPVVVAAFLLTVTVSVKEQFWEIMIAVIILVVLAIGTGVWAFF